MDGDPSIAVRGVGNTCYHLFYHSDLSSQDIDTRLFTLKYYLLYTGYVQSACVLALLIVQNKLSINPTIFLAGKIFYRPVQQQSHNRTVLFIPSYQSTMMPSVTPPLLNFLSRQKRTRKKNSKKEFKQPFRTRNRDATLQCSGLMLRFDLCLNK